ncbi:MAG: CotH kinase family protein [Chitinophagales bacterium]
MRNSIACCFLTIFACSCSFAQTFNSIVNADIPDDGTDISFTMDIAGLPSTIDTDFGLETVCVNMDHTWDSDLEVKLIAPDGTTFLLFTGIGGDGDNFNFTCLNKSAATNIAAGSAPFTGEFIPMGDMGLINNGQDPNGTWTLHVYDTYAFADVGYMYTWTLTFGDEPALPFVFESTNLPIIKIDTYGDPIYDEPKTAGEIFIIDNGVGLLNHPDDTAYAYHGKILTELQGFTGPWYPKKNYDFDLVNDSGIEIDTVLLGLPAENDFILKAEYLDYSLMKNALSYEMSRRMGQYAPRTKFCELVVNGEYMGVFSLTEKIKRDANRVNIDKLNPEDIFGDALTGGYIIEINENFSPNDWNSLYDPINDATCDFPVAFKMVTPPIDSIQPEQLEYIHAYVDSFENALYGDDFLDTMIGYRKFIGVKSFIDFMIVNEFSSNYDSYGRSTFLYKENISDGGQLKIGPPWDYDRAYAPWSVEGWVWEITHPTWPFPFWWSKFREDPEWVNEVYCRYTSLREDVLSNASFHEFIDSIHILLEEPAARNFSKWAELGVTDYDYFVDEISNFVDDRLEWMDDALEPDHVDPPDASFTAELISGLTYQFIPTTTGATYLWDFGDGFTSTEEAPAHTFTGTGSALISLMVDQYYGCSSITTETFNIVMGIEDIQNEVTVFPNPFSEQFTIHFQFPVANSEVSVINYLGQEIINLKSIDAHDIIIHTNQLPAGNYIVKVFDGINYWCRTMVSVGSRQ